MCPMVIETWWETLSFIMGCGECGGHHDAVEASPRRLMAAHGTHKLLMIQSVCLSCIGRFILIHCLSRSGECQEYWIPP